MIRTPEWWVLELSKLAFTALAVLGAVVLMALTHHERMPLQ